MTGEKGDRVGYLPLLWRDRAATAAAIWLALLFSVALVGPWLLGDLATTQHLRLSNLPPLSIGHGWEYVLGSDPLGRSVLARLVVAARTTLLIAVASVSVASVVGTFVGTVAGQLGGWIEAVIMRLADIVLSFPSLLLALIMLYLLGSEPYVIVLVLGITRVPVYLRTARARAREVKQLQYIEAARVLGLSGARILFRHSVPAVVPTAMTLVTLELGLVMLTESALTFLGIGVQPPDVTWGLMVAIGRGYLQSAWWLSFFPGLAISSTVLATNVVSNWARLASDPRQRWRFDTSTSTANVAATTPQAAGAR
jgi:peptide/nickel transport system permease protein